MIFRKLEGFVRIKDKNIKIKVLKGDLQFKTHRKSEWKLLAIINKQVLITPSKFYDN